MRRVGARSTRAALGAWRPTVARHGCGRSARVRPLGAGAAATSAALPCGVARFHFGIVPTQFILHLYTVIPQPLDSIPTDGVHRQMVFFVTKNHKEHKRFANFVSFFRFATFDYRGDKVLVDHDSGLGWILLRTEISRHMKSHAVRPCARRRRRGCPFPGPPCRPGRRRTCVYGRNELHPSRHGHLTRLGRSDAPRRGGAGTSRAGPVRTPRAEAAATSAALPYGGARFHFGTLRREIPLIPPPTAGMWPDRAAHRGGGLW